MQQLMDRLRGRGVDDVLQELTLERVMVNEKARAVLYHFSCASWPKDSTAPALKRACQALTPGWKTQVKLTCPELAGDFAAAPEKYAPLLSQALVREMPGAAPYLRGARWRTQAPASVTLELPGTHAVQILESKRFHIRLSELLRDVFGADMSVTLEASAQIDAEYKELSRREADAKWLAENIRKPSGKSSGEPKAPPPGKTILGRAFSTALTEMRELRDDSGRVAVGGKIVKVETRALRGGQKTLLSFVVTDLTNSILCKAFLDPSAQGPILAAIRPGAGIRVRGDIQNDPFARDLCLMVNDAVTDALPQRQDDAQEKRVELHLHTAMSTMDGLASAKSLIERAVQFGHKALAITDHGVLQAYPEAFDVIKKNKIKLIPGLEGYLVEDCAPVVTQSRGQSLDAAIVVIDIETTGLSARFDAITEIGAVKVQAGTVVDRFSTFVNPGRAIPADIVKLTGISDGMVQDAPDIQAVMPDLAAFCAGCALAAHNASFDASFLSRDAAIAGVKLPDSVVDTLALARTLVPEAKNHRLGTLCKTLSIPLSGAHRAVNDAEATAKLLLLLLARARERSGVQTLDDLNTSLGGSYNPRHSNHIILLAKNQDGLENLYRLVSLSHMDHFYRHPLLPRSEIMKHREGLIIGSACESGELISAIVAGKSDEDLRAIARFYDYLEIQPIGNNAFLVREGKAENDEALRDINRKVVQLGRELNLPIAATGDVHFLDPDDAIYRSILMAGQGFSDAATQPPLYFKTTTEMLEEFSYLGEDVAREVVVETPNRIADMVEPIRMFPVHPSGQETFQPELENAAEIIRDTCERRATELYGDPLPEIVRLRMDKEYHSIIGYGFATLYLSAHLLVRKSLSDGYLVGSRGSVGSSLVAYLLGITEVNALTPHYLCPKCKHSDFSPQADSGVDLPPMDCPECGARMGSMGEGIAFEVFLGFEGDKVPDIDLNFSGVYQPTAHAYVEEIFGKGYVFRAGTITTVAEKTAYGYVQKYIEERGITCTKAEVERLVLGCSGIKRSTGQHPGGMVVLPKAYRITQFTPIQHPADDKESGIITTHFDFNSLHDILVKLDILGHDDPTMIRMLEDLTGVDARSLPFNDPETMSLFLSTDALGVSPEKIGSKTGTLGIPEFGTRFVRQMLEQTQPTTMSELLKISGLSHGTDVWLGNAQDLIQNGTATLRECICCRDDILKYLVSLGMVEKTAFMIMEAVRKGRGLTADQEAAMRAVSAPEWYIESCKKIQYLFPRSHAMAYVMMALRIAYFKVHYPLAYYAAYLTIRATAFDAVTMVDTPDALRRKIAAVDELGRAATARDKDGATVMEIVVEMLERGIRFQPIDLYKSDRASFLIEDGGIRPPLNSMGGVGDSAADAIVEARKNGAFISIEELRQRTRISSAVIETLRGMGVLAGLAETSQVSMF